MKLELKCRRTHRDPAERASQIGNPLANYNLKAKHRMAAEGWNMWLYQLDVEPLDPTVSLANLPAPPRVNCSPELNPNLFDPSPRASVRAN